jgi:hypothetical protein
MQIFQVGDSLILRSATRAEAVNFQALTTARRLICSLSFISMSLLRRTRPM